MKLTKFKSGYGVLSILDKRFVNSGLLCRATKTGHWGYGFHVAIGADYDYIRFSYTQDSSTTDVDAWYEAWELSKSTPHPTGDLAKQKRL